MLTLGTLIACTVSLGLSDKYGIKFSDTSMQEFYGDKIAYVLNSDIYTVAGLDFIVSDIYDSSKSNLEDIKTGKMEAITFDNIMDAIGKVNYNETQNDPNLVAEYGGNCQAYSLLLDAYCKENNIESKLYYTSNHMYNQVHLDNIWYKVDITKGIMEIL